MVEARCMHDFIEEQAAIAPGAIALVSTRDRLSYGELSLRARRMASLLRARGVGPEVKVGLVGERSADTLVALLAVLQAGGAYVPLDPAHPPERLAFLARDAGLALLIAHEHHLGAVPVPELPTLCFERDRAAIEAASPEASTPSALPESLAYVIYTSGSTGAPKGVMIEHRGVADLIAAQRRRFGVGPGARVLQLASLGFDASVWEIVLALAAGAELHLAPASSLLPGEGLVALLEERAITHLTITPSALAALPEAKLPALATVIVAGEACPPELAARWGPGRRFFNAYGPTEATVCATVHEWTQGDRSLPIGHALEHAQLLLLDEERRPVPDGAPGEIYLGGSALARGYLGRPELSAARFLPDPARPGARLYRTGDLARRLPDGAYAFLGRVDQQVKIRGVRVELEEIELRLAEHPAVIEAAVTVHEDSAGERRLVAHVALRSPLARPAVALRRFLARRLPRAFVPRAFVLVDRLPLTPSGKLDRRALAAPSPLSTAPSALGDPELVLPESASERALAAIWSEVLEVDPLSTHDDLLALGGDSLSAAKISARVREQLGRELSPAALLEGRSLASLAASLDAPLDRPTPPALLARPRDGALPLSFAQRRVWFLHQAEPASAAYHLPAAIRLSGPLDPALLARALAALVERHEPLRTTYALVEGEPAQRVGPAFIPALPLDDLRAISTDARDEALAAWAREALAAPFDLAEGPVLRARLGQLDAREHVLLLALHHIAADGWSMGVLVRELASLYASLSCHDRASLAPLSFHYGDHARAEREHLTGERLALGLDLVRRELAGAPRLHALPLDRPRPPSPTHAGAELRFALSPATRAALSSLAERAGATLFMVLLAAFEAWIFRASGADDLVVGTPVAGRDHPAFEGVIGFFAGTVALRASAPDDPPFHVLLRRVRARVLSALGAAFVPFERVVEALRPARDTRHHPLFQLMFALQEPPPEAQAGALHLRFTELDAGASPFDLSVQVWEEGAGLTGTMVYASELFERATAERMLGDLRAVIDQVAAAPDRPLSALRLPSGRAPAPRSSARAIEALLLDDPAIDDLALRVTSKEGEPPSLVACVVASAPLSFARLSEALAERLPEASSPARFVALSSLPIDAQGEVDEAALAELADLGPRASTAPVTMDPIVARSEAIAPGPPAFADGGPLALAEGAPETLTSALLRAAEGEGCLHTYREDGSHRVEPYASLLARARRILGGLQARGLGPGDRAILQVEPQENHFAAFWACVLGGIVPLTVAIAPSYEVESGVTAKLHNAWALLGRPPILAGRALEGPLRGLAAWYPAMAELSVLVVEELLEHAPSARLHPARPDDLAFFQLSSGSTGVPKCIQETHRGILLHVEGSRRFNDYRPSDVTLNWLPLDHVVPILTCHLKDITLGATEIQVATSLVLEDPLRWLDLLERHRVTHTWSPNFGFKLVSDALREARQRTPERRWDLGAVRAFMNAGEQVTFPVVRDFLRALAPFGVEEQAMQPAFGMAEVCTCMTYVNDFSLGRRVHWVDKSSLGGALVFTSAEARAAIAFVDLGPPMPGVQIRIADEANRVVPEGKIGRLQIKGGVTTPGYLDNPAANAEAFPGEGWFNSGDLGFLRDGRLALTGREKEMIIVRGSKFLCYEVEDVAGAVPGVLPTFVASSAVEEGGEGTEGLAIFFVPSDPREGDAIARAIRARVAASLGIAPSVVVVLTRATFPKTTSGKIQRAQLKKELAAGKHENALARGAPRGPAAPRIHRRIWQRREARGPEAAPRAGTRLIFLDERGLGRRLAGALEHAGNRCILVDHGASFATLGPDHFRIDLASFDDHRRLLATIDEGGPPLVEIVHLITYGREARAPGADLGGAASAFGLLGLCHALAQRGEGRGALRLSVVSTSAQAVSEGEALAPDYALMLGLVLTVPEELPWAFARHLDLEGQDIEADASSVLAEGRSARRVREIAYRGGQRLVSRLVAIEPESVDTSRSPFVDGGLYLLSGGLGGLGAALAEHLLSQHRARLLLVGRSALEGDPAKRARFDRLEACALRAGGALRYVAVDIADRAAIEGAVESAEERWGRRLDGVLHLAGTLSERLLGEETRASVAETWRPKVEGSRALAEVLEQRPGGLFVAFSSVNGLLGGFAAGAYSAASRFQEHFALALARRGKVQSRCIGWTLWDDVGMSAGGGRRSAAAARGLSALRVEEGIQRFVEALSSGRTSLFVGLDEASPAIARHGARARVMPFAGEAPRAKEEAVVPPRNEHERTIAAIWRELLALPEVSVNRNFFELGGHSLLLARVRARLREAFGRDVPILEMFRHPTVSALAAHLGQSEEPASGRVAIDERAAKQLAARARRRPEAPSRKSRDG
jgi:nonribosomal peptide synthetase DhbF